MSVMEGFDTSGVAHPIKVAADGTVQTSGSGGGASTISGGQAAAGAAATTAPVTVAGSDGTLTRTILTDTAGRVKVDGAYTPGSTKPGSGVGAITATDGTNGILIKVNAAGNIQSNSVPQTSGGLLTARVVTGTGNFVKASAGQLYSIVWQNANAAVRYLQIYNKASAPTLSTDTPVLTIPMAASSTGAFVVTDLGIAFATGIAWAFTTDDVAIPTTAGASGELHATFVYF